MDWEYTGVESIKRSGQWWRALRHFLFSFDAEHMHEAAILFLKLKSWLIEGTRPKIVKNYAELKIESMGLSFKNPVGLAAGFDVDGECIPALEELGFGFIEVGGIT